MPTQTPATNTKPVPVSPAVAPRNERVASPTSDRPRVAIAAVDLLESEERFDYLGDAVQRLLDAVPAANISTINPLNQNVPTPQITKGLTPTTSGVQFTFTEISDPLQNRIDGYRVYRNTTNAFSGATPIRFYTQSSLFSSITVDDVVPNGVVNYYFLTAVGVSGAESAPVAAQATAVASGSVVDPTGSVVVAGTSVVDSAGNILLKNVTTAVGSTSSPTTTSLSFSADVPEMSITITTHGRPVLVSFNGTFSQSAGIGKIRLFRDAVAIGGAGSNDGFVVATNLLTVALIQTDTPAAGSHTYHAMWEVTTGGTTLTAQATSRFLQVAELG